jgi:hypothetical protein
VKLVNWYPGFKGPGSLKLVHQAVASQLKTVAKAPSVLNVTSLDILKEIARCGRRKNPKVAVRSNVSKPK